MHAFAVSDPPNIKSGPDVLELVPDVSIGISEVRQVQGFLAKKPMQEQKNVVVIHQAHLLTIPAQNALLKTLEEPQGNSVIYLVTNQPDQLLPTVLSRVEVNIAQGLAKADSKKLAKSQKFLQELQDASIGKRLRMLEDQKLSREQALQFIDDVEQLIHQDLSLANLYDLAAQTRRYLKANCNVRLCLNYLASSI